MKSVQFVGSLLLFMSVSASAQIRAGNEGPQGEIPLPRTVLAEKVTSGGFAALPQTVTLRIMVDGSVEKFSQNMYGNGPVSDQKIAQLSADTLAGLISTISNVQPGDLVDENPSAPKCMDAPEVGYFVFDTKNNRIQTAGEDSCHKSSLETSEAISVENVLDGLETLGQLSNH